MTLPAQRTARLGNPHHAASSQLAPVGGDLAPLPERPPRGLGKDGRALWRSAAVSGAGSWLRASDAALLRQVCEQTDLRAELAADVKARGAVVLETILVPGQQTQALRPNPSIATMIALDREIAKGLKALGLTPTDRAQLGLVTASAENEFDKWLRGHAGARSDQKGHQR